MARQLHRTGTRYRTAKQRQQLKKAQLISARKRTRNKHLAIGLASGIAVAGIGAVGYKQSGKQVARTKAKLKAYPLHRANTPDWTDGDKIHQTRKAVSGELKVARKKKAEIKRRRELSDRNRARRLNPAQRAESQAKRSAYLSSYNARRKAKYAAEQSVKNGMRSRKPRAKETKPRKRKTD